MGAGARVYLYMLVDLSPSPSFRHETFVSFRFYSRLDQEYDERERQRKSGGTRSCISIYAGRPLSVSDPRTWELAAPTTLPCGSTRNQACRVGVSPLPRFDFTLSHRGTKPRKHGQNLKKENFRKFYFYLKHH